MFNEISDGAQLHTLEGIAASVILLLAMSYAFNAFVVTPTSDVKPGTETNQKVAEDLLAVSESSGELKRLLLNWNETSDQQFQKFENSTEGTYYYESENPDAGHLEFGNNTKAIFTQEGLSYNINAEFGKENGTGTLTVVDMGEPGTSASTASRTVVLNNDDNVTDPSGNNVTLVEADSYPIPKTGKSVYNRVEVRITVW